MEYLFCDNNLSRYPFHFRYELVLVTRGFVRKYLPLSNLVAALAWVLESKCNELHFFSERDVLGAYLQVSDSLIFFTQPSEASLQLAW